MIYISIILSFLYAALMLWLLYGIKKLPKNNNNFAPPEKSFSICIAYRNEAKNLPVLLKSIQQLNYPADLFEVILVNDQSSDDSEEIVANFKASQKNIAIKMLYNTKTKNPKKQALKLAVSTAKHSYILTTDADCSLPSNWLQYYNTAFCTQDSKLIAGPVSYPKANSFFEHFQYLDFLSLQAATLGGFGNKHPFLSNAANLGYAKNTVENLYSYSDNEKIVSGDDIFLLEKMRQKQQVISYLFSSAAAVKTIPPQNWKALFSQRVRWAAKTSAYQFWLPKAIGVLIFLTNLFWIVVLLGAIFQFAPSSAFLVLFFVKLNVDFIVLYTLSKFYKEENLMRKFIGVAALHPIFNTAVAIKALFGGFTWKERKFKR